MIPQFVLIIGAMKSGTTTVYDYLTNHPQIAGGIEKEPGFFAFEEHWALGLDWYEFQFGFNEGQHRYALDGSTDYSKHPFCDNVIERLRASTPRRFKLIYIMRHPLRRIESHARHVASTKREIGRCLSPRKTHDLDSGISPVSMAVSRYAYQIDIFEEFYDSGDLLLLTLEELARDTNAALGKLCDFLKIDPVHLNKGPLKSNVGEVDTARYTFHQSLFPIWKSLKRITPLRSMVRSFVPQAVLSNVYSAVETWARPDGRFTLNAGEEQALMAALEPDLIRLRDRYGIDIKNEWGIDL